MKNPGWEDELVYDFESFFKGSLGDTCDDAHSILEPKKKKLKRKKDVYHPESFEELSGPSNPTVVLDPEASFSESGLQGSPILNPKNFTMDDVCEELSSVDAA